MKNERMKKIMLMMITGLLILGFSTAVQGKSDNKYRSDHRYYSDEPDNRGYSSHHQYHPRRNYPEDRQYYYKSQRQILKETRKNERRIRKLEHKLEKYYRKKYYYRYSNRYKYHYYVRVIRQLEWEISRLVHRNRYLNGRLHR
jgi:hypothetical protein